MHSQTCLFVGQFSAFSVGIEVSKPVGTFYGLSIKRIISEIFELGPIIYQG